MRFDVVTIFPAMFGPVFSQGVVGRALREDRLQLITHDLRDYAPDPRHRQIDDAPFGGGAGMVMKAEPILAAVEAIRPRNPGPVILMEPWGERLTRGWRESLPGSPG